MDVIDEVRSFNRFYTGRIGLLDEHLSASPFSLAEARVLYELANREDPTAADIARALDMDTAHLSRIVARFRARGLIESRVSPQHGKLRLLSLTPAGHESFASLDAGTRSQLEAILAPVPQETRERVASAMRSIRAALAGERPSAVSIRALVPGDLGWITHRQAILYNREYGWDWTYEGLVSRILGGFAETFDPASEDAWVAEHDGAIAGSIFLMRGKADGTGQLRLLYVEPDARGLGIGRRLVSGCIDRARELGYRRLTLWTNDVLASARRIYEAAGFRLIEQTPHQSFGHDLIGQTWTLDL